MICYASIWGGASYAWPDKPDRFDSLDAVMDEYRLREQLGRGSDGLATPCWGDRVSPEPVERVGHVWLSDPSGEAYPDFMLERGPRGGLRMVRT